MSRFNVSHFFSPPDDEFLCGICKNVLDKPLETPCRHVFCEFCIHKALLEKPKCPLCRCQCSESTLKEVLPLVQNLINKLTLKCSNFIQGCTAPIKLEYYHEHIEKCEFTILKCMYNGCNVRMIRKDIEEHEINECPYRKKFCEKGCNLMLKISEIETHNCVTALLSLVKDLIKKNNNLHQAVAFLQTKTSVLLDEFCPISDESNSSCVTLSYCDSSFDSNLSENFDLDARSLAQYNSPQEISDTEDAPEINRNYLSADINTKQSPLDSSDSSGNIDTIVPSSNLYVPTASTPTGASNFSLLSSFGNKRSQEFTSLQRIKKVKNTVTVSDDEDCGDGQSISANNLESKKYYLRNQCSQNVLPTQQLSSKLNSVQHSFSSQITPGLLASDQDGENLSGISQQNPYSAISQRRSSARLRKEPVSCDIDLIPDVKVSPNFAYLLRKYCAEDSSDDEPWSPSD